MIDFQSMPPEYRFSGIHASGNPMSGCDSLASMAKSGGSKAERERSEFGARLVKARKEAKLTQTELATRSGVKLSTLAEAEISGAGSTYTAQMAKVLGVDAYWLATGEGEMLASAAQSSPLEMDAETRELVTAFQAIKEPARRAVLVRDAQAAAWATNQGDKMQSKSKRSTVSDGYAGHERRRMIGEGVAADQPNPGRRAEDQK